MKILNISFHNRFIQPLGISENNKPENKNFNCTILPFEILGRSQVAFGENLVKLNYDDKKFIYVVSRDLRFSDEQKIQFKNIVQDYLKENKLKSMDDINSDGSDEQACFLNKVSEKMNLSDVEFDVLNFHILDRIYCDGVYLPEDRRFIKDLPIIEPIFGKYGLDEDSIDSITDVMLIDADNLKCKTLFDIFNQHAEVIEDSLFYNALLDIADDDICTNIIIDLCLKSKQYEIEGENIFPRHEDRAKFYNSLDDEFITDNILEEFNINKAEGENIFNSIIRRHGNITLQQIAYEIAEEYNLPPKADKKIIEIIKNKKSLNELLEQFED